MSEVLAEDSATHRLDRYLERAVPFGFSGAALVATAGEVRLARGYGQASPARSNRSTTVFSIGSITKTLTATAVLVLAERSLLGLQDRLGDRLAGVPSDKAGITVEQLLSHTAGLESATGGDFDPGERDDVLGDIFAAPLVFAPGTDWAYSNTGYSVLAALIEDVAGSSYEQALRDLVLEPAEMARTGYVLPAWDRADMAHSFVGDTDLGIHLDKTFPSWHIMGNGEMLSTVGDLHRLTRALRSGRLLDETTLADAWRPRRRGYALGWVVDEGSFGRVAGHDGASTNGISAVLRWYHDRDTVIAILCNRDYGGDFLVHAVAPHVEALVFGGSAPEPPAASPAKVAPGREIVGHYVTAAGGAVTIESAADGYVARLTGQDVLDLVAGGGTDPGAHVEDSLELIASIIGGDDAAVRPHLGSDRQKFDRYRRFAVSRVGSDPSQLRVDGAIRAELSVGPATAVQLSASDRPADQALRVFWRGSELLGLGLGSNPLLRLPLVPVGPDRFALHHLQLGTTTTVRHEDDRLLLEGPEGSVVSAHPMSA